MVNYNPFSLEGKTILITGASSGIGRATAIECSKMGATLVITGRNAERLNDTFITLQGDGHKQIVADQTDENDLKELVVTSPSYDGVFFCAGITDTTPLRFMTQEKMSRIFSVNLIAPSILTKLLVSGKKLNKCASLVYVSSMGAVEVTPGLGIYAASKNGLNSIVKTIALELSARKIRANSIMPMMVQTELVNNLTSLSSEDLAKDEAKYPLGYGKPQDVAYAAIYLLSDASSWVTGIELHLTGGGSL